MRLLLSFPELNTHSEAVIVSVESFPLTLLRKTLRGIEFRQLSRIFFFWGLGHVRTEWRGASFYEKAVDLTETRSKRLLVLPSTSRARENTRARRRTRACLSFSLLIGERGNGGRIFEERKTTLRGL